MCVCVFGNILLCSTCKFPNVHTATFPLIKRKTIKCTEKIGCAKMPLYYSLQGLFEIFVSETIYGVMLERR